MEAAVSARKEPQGRYDREFRERRVLKNGLSGPEQAGAPSGSPSTGGGRGFHKPPRPALGLAMAFFLFSLAGMPPTAGFLGKYVIFQAAIKSERYLLAVVGVLNAVVAAYYYLRVIVIMYMREAETDELPLPVSPATAAVMVVCVIGVLYLGIAPGRLLDLVRGLAAALI